MFLKKLTAYHFKNYPTINISFSPGFNFIFGSNGTGKTNLLEGIYYLCMTKGCIGLVNDTKYYILHGKESFALQGVFNKKNLESIVKCEVQKKNSKAVFLNGDKYKKLSEHIGKFPIIPTLPQDESLIMRGSEGRRKFFDQLLIQTQPKYLQALIQYHKYLKQRNSLLKEYEKNLDQSDILTYYNEQLIKLGKIIYESRKLLIDTLYLQIERYYQKISKQGEQEKVTVTYTSALKDPLFSQKFLNNLPKDIIMKRTLLGIHQDDFTFSLNDHPIKKTGSQGQQKSLIIALRLAQYQYMKETLGFPPILLLDDIFAKLDNHRIYHLLHIIAENSFGQVFLTDARKLPLLTDIIKSLGLKAKTFEIKENNTIEKI